MFQTKVVETTKTQIMFSVTFLFENRAFRDNVGEYSIVGKATDDNKAHAHCLLDT
jgi:hypothetical protein